jgi:prepilin-type N-terminal cleavage/methylation domain-containing protein
MIKNYKKTLGGFTLVEMLVSLGLFAVVSTMSIGTLLVLIEVNGRAQAMQLVMTNFTFSIDAMTREIRTGYDWVCRTNTNSAPEHEGIVSDCLNGTGRLISVVETGNVTSGGALNTGRQRRITYWLNPNYYGPGHGAIMRRIFNGSIVPITGQDVIIDQFRITARGTSPLSSGDVYQPTATIYIKGRSGFVANGATDNTKDFELQTTIVQRLLDV